MQVTGVIVMLSAAPKSRRGVGDLPQVSVIGAEVFRRHEWRAEGGGSIIGLKGARDALNLLKGGVEMKQNHQMNMYLSLLSELLRDQLQDASRIFGSSDPTKRGRCIRYEGIVNGLALSSCEATFLMNGDLRVIAQGQGLELAVLASVEHTNSSLEPGKLSARKVTSSKLRSVPGSRHGERLEVVFRFPDDYKLNSSSVTFRLTNWFQAAHSKLTIPFNTVWLVGKTGAGKTELRHAFERELVASKPAKKGRSWLRRGRATDTVSLSEDKQGPRVHVVPELHQEEERAFEYDRIHLYEFNGFTDFSAGDSKAFLGAIAKHPPRIILLILNVADTLTDKERLLLIKFIEHVRGMKEPELPIWFVFSHVSMVDERIRPRAISDLKKALRIVDGRDRCFFVDSVEFKSGPVSIPTQGVPELYASIFEKLAELDSMGLTPQNRRALITNAFKAMLILAWQNKQTIVTTLMGMGGFVYYGLKMTGRL